MNLYDKHMISPSSLWLEIIRVLTRNSQGKWKWNIPCIGSMSLLTKTLIYFSCLVWISSVSHLSLQVWVIHFSSHMPIPFRHHEFWSYLESNCSTLWSHVTNVQDKSYLQLITYTLSDLLLQSWILFINFTLFLVLCWWWGNIMDLLRRVAFCRL